MLLFLLVVVMDWVREAIRQILSLLLDFARGGLGLLHLEIAHDRGGVFHD